MKWIRDNGRQSFWEHNGNYYICSTSLDNSEVMVFKANPEGKVIDYLDLYVNYTKVNSHDYHMARFSQENSNGS